MGPPEENTNETYNFRRLTETGSVATRTPRSPVPAFPPRSESLSIPPRDGPDLTLPKTYEQEQA